MCMCVNVCIVCNLKVWSCPNIKHLSLTCMLSWVEVWSWVICWLKDAFVPLPQMELPPRPTLFDFNGVAMTKYFTDNWENVQNVKARPDDIIIAAYPKAGLYGTPIFFFCMISVAVSPAIIQMNNLNSFLNFQGNTWMSYILDLLYFSDMSPERQDSVPLYERVPFLEIQIPGFPSGKVIKKARTVTKTQYW